MLYLKIFVLVNLTFYCLGILWFIIGALKSKQKVYTSNIADNLNVSVIVCVKNGESSLPNILKDLSNQIYNSKIEFIIVDDNSFDNTKVIINEFVSKDNRFKYVHSLDGSENLKFKKRALDAGIKFSKYDYLLFTDVDCRVGNNWAQSIANNFINGSDYVIGYSKVANGSKFVSKFQQIDFMMLMYAALGSTTLKYPIASTGQNQAYKKSLFKHVNGFNKISHLMQGDDSIFLNICKKSANTVINFSKNPSSFVKSKVHTSWKDFILQRARWAGDANIMWKYNKLFFIYILSTFFINLFLFLSPFLFFILGELVVIAYLLKLIFELLLYLIGTYKFNETLNILLFLKWFLLQPMYVFFMGIFSFYQNNINWRNSK